MTSRQLNTLINKYNKLGGCAVNFQTKGMVSIDGKLQYASVAIKKMEKFLNA